MFEYAIIIKVVLAALLGAAVGFERELARKVAGIRTHALVCLASALFTAISIDAFKAYIGSGGDGAPRKNFNNHLRLRFLFTFFVFF